MSSIPRHSDNIKLSDETDQEKEAELRLVHSSEETADSTEGGSTQHEASAKSESRPTRANLRLVSNVDTEDEARLRTASSEKELKSEIKPASLAYLENSEEYFIANLDHEESADQDNGSTNMTNRQNTFKENPLPPLPHTWSKEESTVVRIRNGTFKTENHFKGAALFVAGIFTGLIACGLLLSHVFGF